MKRFHVNNFLLFNKNSTLIAGPYRGEFGWELMEWQGYIRKLKEKYKRVIVISRENSRYLYEGCDFFPLNIKLQNSGYAYGNEDINMDKDIFEECKKSLGVAKADWLLPFSLNRINKSLIGKQKFIKFYESPYHKNVDVVFHFRNFVREDGDYKNYSKAYADELYQMCKNNGISCGVIGHPDLSYCPPGCNDFRSKELKNTVATISNAKLVVGGSSAPMHLSCICDKPIVVWIGPPFSLGAYYKRWNPFDSKIYGLTETSFQPLPKDVFSTIEKALKK